MELLPVILGPTAVGKTELAIEIAGKLNVEIVSCDSRQIYKYMDIGTGKPTVEQQNRAKHWLINVITPDIPYNAWEYAIEGRKTIEKLRKADKIPIIVGGSGLYLRALIDGFFTIPKPPKDLREKLNQETTTDLYAKLEKVDPSSASKLHPNDRVRIIRAIEVYEATGKPISELRKQKVPAGYEPVYIGLTMERETLYKRIEERVDKMMATGFVDEVKSLITKYSTDLPAFQTIGYKELIAYLQDKSTLEEAINLIKQNTRRYAKRQMTWFRRIENVKWMELTSKNYSKITNNCLNLIQI